VILAACAAVWVTALGAGGATRHTSASVLVQRTVAHPGHYTVLVSVPASARPETVTVSVGSQVQRGVPIGPDDGQELAFFVKLATRKLVVRGEAFTFGSASPLRHPPHFTVAVASAASALTAPTTGPYRTLAWSDDFSGPAGSAPSASNWSPGANSGCGASTLSQNTTSLANASLDGAGNLAITALPDPAFAGTAHPYSSAQLETTGHYTFTYGDIQARMELPAGSGLCSAFWLLQAPAAGTSCAPCTEADILEQISAYPNVGYADLHGPVQGSPTNAQWQGHVISEHSLSGTFHTWGLIWSPDRLTWTLDGLPYATATPSTLNASAQWGFNAIPMRIILDLAVGGWPGPPTSSRGFPASLRVDWVRVYQ
jgi:beta-glucanase (GH16 family)